METEKNKKNIGLKTSEKSFAVNTLTLAGSNTISQIISVVASIVLARLYAPAEMGIYSTYFSIIAVLTVIATLQYENAIVLTTEEKEASDVVALCIAILFGLAIIGALIIFPLKDTIAKLLKSENIGEWLLLIPVSFAINGLTNIYVSCNVRKSSMGTVAATALVASFCAVGFQILFGLDTFHLFGGMILGHIAGHGIAVLILVLLTKRHKILKEKADVPGIKAMAKRYKRFPLFLVPSTFLDSLGASAPNLLLAVFFGSAVAGYYALSYRLLSMPVSVIGGAIGKAFLPKAVEAQNNGSLSQASENVFITLLRLGTTPICLLALVAPELVAFVFGREWMVSGQYVRWLCPWILFMFLYSPLSNLFVVAEKQKQFMFFNAAVLAVRIVSLAIGGIFSSDMLAVLLCGITGAIISLAGCIYVLKLVDVSGNRLLIIIVKQLFRTLPYLLPTIILLALNAKGMLCVCISILSGCAFLIIESKTVFSLMKLQSK